MEKSTEKFLNELLESYSKTKQSRDKSLDNATKKRDLRRVRLIEHKNFASEEVISDMLTALLNSKLITDSEQNELKSKFDLV